MEKIQTKTSAYQLVVTALFAAITCIIAPNAIPLPMSPVPVSLTLLVIYLSAYCLGAKLATTSYIIYLLLGLVGLPVFSGYTGGPGKLAGPTGGYLIGFILTALIVGFFIEKFQGKIYLHVLGMILGLAVCYLFGTIWFCAQQKMDFASALAVCVIPFLIGDALKIILAAIAGPLIRKRLKKAGLV